MALSLERRDSVWPKKKGGEPAFASAFFTLLRTALLMRREQFVVADAAAWHCDRTLVFDGHGGER